MNIIEFISNNVTVLDGAMGTMLQKRGLKIGELPERWNISHCKTIKEIHLEYLNAGADVITTNTFGANLLKFDAVELEEIVKNAVLNAKNAIKESGLKNKFIALDIGPSGKLLAPYGDLDFEKAVEVFGFTAKLGEKYGADLVIIETMNDLYETKAAVLGVKENCNLPIFVSNAYSEGGNLMTGSSPLEIVTTLEGLGVIALGANCSFGPNGLRPIIEKVVEYSSTPVLFMPNAGMPKIVDGKTTFDISIDEFTLEVKKAVENGVRIIGGCCGTTPDYIRSIKEATSSIKPLPINKKHKTMVCSGLKSVEIGLKPIIIGERINPTGKKRFRQALIENDVAYILQEGLTEQEKGANVLDVNVGIPDVDESVVLENIIKELQSVVEVPLEIDTSNFKAMEKAIRIYNGKPLINSVCGKVESMQNVFPIVKKYGGVVVALTLDENGIPESKDGRVAIAKKILDTSQQYGIKKEDIIFDTLCMSISTNNKAAEITASALKEIKERFGVNTVLGISNISYGLPNREEVNAEFLSYALTQGLDAAIINPLSEPVMQAIRGFNGEKNIQKNITEYAKKVIDNSMRTESSTNKHNLYSYVLCGQKESAKMITIELLKNKEALNIVNEYVIPALDTLGRLYEEGKMFLPQLLMGAESAKASFEVIKEKASENAIAIKRSKIVLATVEGDIHDIGKNIVKLLLENYGFEVIDLGKDVKPEAILKAVTEQNALLLGLSALMTTTVVSMEKTVKLIKEHCPNCKIVVGGAVLNKDYAEKMGADYYAKDALATVRFAESNS